MSGTGTILKHLVCLSDDIISVGVVEARIKLAREIVGSEREKRDDED